MSETDPPYAEAADWLDGAYPGWEEKIDLDDFNMHDDCKCIGGYLGVDWYDVLGASFTSDTGLDRSGVFSGGNNEWRRLIQERLLVPA